jgi:hypothetical protein
LQSHPWHMLTMVQKALKLVMNGTGCTFSERVPVYSRHVTLQNDMESSRKYKISIGGTLMNFSDVKYGRGQNIYTEHFTRESMGRREIITLVSMSLGESAWVIVVGDGGQKSCRRRHKFSVCLICLASDSKSTTSGNIVGDLSHNWLRSSYSTVKD